MEGNLRPLPTGKRSDRSCALIIRKDVRRNSLRQRMRDFAVPLDAGNPIVVVDEYNDCFQILLLEFRAIDPGFGEDDDLVAGLNCA